MKRLQGILLVILALGLLGPAPPFYAQKATTPEANPRANSIRRDLGEKGKIIIDSLDLNEADLADVVRLLARIAGLNIITGDLRGSVTVYLENVTVESALQAILASQGYGFLFDGNIVRVVDASKLGEDRVETITETFLLNYLPADTVATNLRKVFSGAQAGSSLSQIEANVEANAIIVVDIPRRVEEIRRLLQTLDQRFQQVEIEGRFVEISYNQDQEIGVDWKYFQDPANTLDVNLAPGALNASNVAGQFKFAIINGRDNLTGFLQALETNNDIRILADPKILALENKEATIELVDEIPFIEANVSQGVVTESVQFQQTGIRLVVTPQIAEEPDGTFVRMKLELEQRIPGPNVVLQNSVAFPIDSRHAMSELIVPDDSTVIIGGLRSNDVKYTYDKIPVLGNIPLLGNAFRRRAKTDDQKELLLFVTPRVIYDHPPLDCKEQELHDKIDRVADSLETQSEWRETAEAPFELFEKDVLYSGVENNQGLYNNVLREKARIEKVKPYKVSKPKGKRKVVVTNENGVLHKEVIEEEAPLEEGEETAPATGEVRSFKAIEKLARPGEGRPVDEFLSQPEPEQQLMPIPEEGFPLMMPPQGGMVPLEAPVPQQAPSGGSPSWLRKKARDSSDAGMKRQDLPPTLEEGTPSVETAHAPHLSNPTGPNSEAVPAEIGSPLDELDLTFEQTGTLSLVDEIPFGPISEELKVEKAMASHSDPESLPAEDPWGMGLPPLRSEPAPLVDNGQARQAQLLSEAEAAARQKIKHQADSTSLPKNEAGQIKSKPTEGVGLPTPPAAPPEEPPAPASQGFLKTIELHPPVVSRKTMESDPKSLPVPELSAAQMEAERLFQMCSGAISQTNDKNNLVDEANIIAYNDPQTNSAQVPAPQIQNQPRSWWRRIIPQH